MAHVPAESFDFMKNAAASGELLTRTTLRLDGSLTPVSLAGLIRSLQQVPGVLVAEANALGDRALLAHDGAVPMGALLAAAATLGVRATVEHDPERTLPATGATPPARPGNRARAVTLIGVAVFIVLGAIDAYVPALRANRIVSIALIGAVWSFFLVDAYLHRTR
jgi:hypothetical protein